MKRITLSSFKMHLSSPWQCLKQASRCSAGLSTTLMLSVLLLCSCRQGKTVEEEASGVTAEMAFEGVNKYCHDEYDWSITEENPEIMYVTMGDETETEYKVVFRSYTGSLVNFYVDKASGHTRMVDYVPSLNIEEERGSIDIHDYLEKSE